MPSGWRFASPRAAFRLTDDRRVTASARTHWVLHALAVVFAVIAAICMIVAIAGMATGNQNARTGWAVRAIALASFVTAVVLNIAAH